MAMQRDLLYEVELKRLELDKMKSIADAEEKQMHRIGRYLHDEVGGNLHALLHIFNHAEKEEHDKQIELLQKAVALTKKSIDSVRMTSQELVPYFLMNFGLSRTLQSIAEETNEISGCKMYYTEKLEWPVSELSQEDTIQLYRLIQEVYSNVIRHAKPSEISFELSTSGECLLFRLDHNGIGISQSEYENLLNMGKSLGLKNIDYRKRLLNAEVHYQRQRDQSEVIITLPKKSKILN
jgi:signal transduction histidine kinase